MRLRTVILALAGVLTFNALIVLGVWLGFRISRGAGANHSGDEVQLEAERIVDEPSSDAPRLAEPSVSVSSNAPSEAAFDSPQDNEAVPRRFQASGRCASVPAGQRLMLVVQTGRVFSPKMPPLVPDGEKWSGTVNEFGMPVGASFTLCLFQVSDAGVDEIAQWYAQGKASGRYPPFREVPGGVCLAKIKLRVARGSG